MIRFDRNFHFCYIPPTSKVYTLCRHRLGQLHGANTVNDSERKRVSLNQIASSQELYTVPYVSRISNEAINVLFGFASKESCINHLSDMRNSDLGSETIGSSSPLPYLCEYDLEDMKALSSMLKMQLIIEVDKKGSHYELYYYKDPVEKKNT